MYVNKKTKLNDEILKKFVVNLEDTYNLAGDSLGWIKNAITVLNAIESQILNYRLEESKNSSGDMKLIAVNNLRNRIHDIENVTEELESLISEIEDSVIIEDSI